MKALQQAPAIIGTRMHCTSCCSRGHGDSATAPASAPSTAGRMKGIVKMPIMLLLRVRSSASAVLPPTACRSSRHSTHNTRFTPISAPIAAQVVK